MASPPLPCIGDGRQSGTSGSPSILNASPEAAAMGGLALLKTRRPGADRFEKGHGQYPDIRRGTCKTQSDLEAAGGFKVAESQTPWQEIHRSMIGQFDKGMVLEPAVKYQDVAHTKGLPRDNH